MYLFLWKEKKNKIPFKKKKSWLNLFFSKKKIGLTNREIFVFFFDSFWEQKMKVKNPKGNHCFKKCTWFSCTLLEWLWIFSHL